MWKAIVGSLTNGAQQEEEMDGKSISSEDHDVEIPGGGEAASGSGLEVPEEAGPVPQTPRGLEQLNAAAVWEPPANLDLRPCHRCGEHAYLRKMACVNSECVFQLRYFC